MMKKRQRSCSRSLPHEIITDILVRLPVKSILPLRSVCKNWCSLFSDSYFIKLHYNHAVQHDKFGLVLNYHNGLYSLGSDSLLSNKSLDMTHCPCIPFQHKLIFVGSCCGLICFTYRRGNDMNIQYLWNPSTDECRRLPSPLACAKDFLKYKIYGRILTISHGFGFYYDCKLDDYKLLIIQTVSNGYDLVASTVELYTLGSNSWNLLFDKFNYEIIQTGRGVLVNGALHWMATPYINEIKEASYNVIVSFDVVNERFKEVHTPKVLNKKLSSDSSQYIELGVLSEYLCIFDNTRTVRTDLWVMKEYGVSKSWAKLFTFLKDKVTRTISPIKCFGNGDMLFQRDGKDLVLYDKLKQTTISKLSDILHNFEAVTCIRSLVSLNSGVYLKQELDNGNP